MAPLYGEETCVLDVHNLSHIVECGKLGTFVGLLIFFSFQSFNGEILKAIHGKGHVSGKVYWAVHSEKQILKIKSNCFRMEKLKISWKKLTSRNTLKNKNLEICEQCYEEVKMNKIAPSLAKKLSMYLKVEEYKLQKIDIFIALKIQGNRFVFYGKQCGRVKRNNHNTYFLQRPINGCDIVQVEYFIHSNSLRKTMGMCSGFQRVYNLVQGHLMHKFWNLKVIYFIKFC